jgi:hypothetical protein
LRLLDVEDIEHVASQFMPSQSQARFLERVLTGDSMTPQDQITKMTTAIGKAIQVMGDRFGSREQDVATAIHELKISMQKEAEPTATLGSSTTTKQPGSAG